jgi:ABC-type transport system involved in multi-copper enzyme maturation permease subunit
VSTAATEFQPAAIGQEMQEIPRPSGERLWQRQLAAVTWLELRRTFLSRRALGPWLLALLPVSILALRALWPGAVERPGNVGEATAIYAANFQFHLRLIIFFGCVAVFGNLIRREVLDRSLHYAFLTPVRRELLVLGKYLAGLLGTALLFAASTAAGFVFAYLPYRSADFFQNGPGIGHLLAYLGVTVLGCIGYGALFLALAFFVKSPAIPAVALFGWEQLNFLLPPVLKRLSVIHYLQGLTPVPVDHGPLAVITEPTSPWLSVPGLILLAGALLALAAWKARRMEIYYEGE